MIMQPGKRWRRRVVGVVWRAVVALVLGVVTTVGVAWGLAFRDIRDPGVRSSQFVQGEERGRRVDKFYNTFQPGTLTVEVHGESGALCIESCAVGTSYPKMLLDGIPIMSFEAWIECPPEDLVPSWSRDASVPWITRGKAWPRGSEVEQRLVVGRGWPCVALYALRERPGGGADVDHGALKLPGSRVWRHGGTFGKTDVVALPCLPLWRGLAADVGVFGSAWLVVMALLAGVRRMVRRRPGCCARCGYDLRGLAQGVVCPECGAAPSKLVMDARATKS